jgi:hypothetical protein
VLGACSRPRYLAAYESASPEAAQLVPIHRRLHDRLAAQDIGFTRWLDS